MMKQNSAKNFFERDSGEKGSENNKDSSNREKVQKEQEPSLYLPLIRGLSPSIKTSSGDFFPIRSSACSFLTIMQDRSNLFLFNPRLSLRVLFGQLFLLKKPTGKKTTCCHTSAHDPKIPQAPRECLLDSQFLSLIGDRRNEIDVSRSIRPGELRNWVYR